VVRMATRNGASALGHETGQLIAGHKADVILIDTHSTMFTPLMPGSSDHVFSHLVFAANGSCVDTTIVDGRVLMEGRRIVTVDEDEVIREAKRAFQEVEARMVVPELAGV
jgi:5-methylthioadenosine/S-adenosylhomocysteine deaminase